MYPGLRLTYPFCDNYTTPHALFRTMMPATEVTEDTEGDLRLWKKYLCGRKLQKTDTDWYIMDNVSYTCL